LEGLNTCITAYPDIHHDCTKNLTVHGIHTSTAYCIDKF